MSLAAGSRIGPFEISALLGAGGMGEVYRARDTRLNRDIALKILPHAVATDPERLTRFKREAQVLATLNHPHIGAIYGIEEQPGTATDFSRSVHALVLELVEGPTLADRIAAGSFAIDEALAVARQIAEALEAAHQQGIIHRDLKPANIKLREDGFVKVLDFGLAKFQEPAVGATSTGASMPASLLPTITTPAATVVGTILGTAAYMAPEQARGRTVDRRADVWAFGCVLYEMLTGRRAFPGDDVTETIATVVKSEPDWSALPADLSPAVRVFLRRCLAKNADERVRDIGDVRLALEGAFDVAAAAVPAAPLRQGHPRTRALAGALLLIVGTTLAVLWLYNPPTVPAPVRRFVLSAGNEQLWIANQNRDVVITPDGSRVLYFAVTEQGRQLYVRSLDSLEATPIRQAERFFEPFMSPDGRWVAFNDEADFVLRKMPITGGPPTTILKLGTEMLGATWGPDDTIVFGRTEPGTGLRRVPAGGGTPVVLTTPDQARGETAHAWPEFLPGGRAVVFTILSGQRGEEFQIAALDLETGTVTRLLTGSSARFIPSGHLVFTVDTTIQAVPFDPVRVELLGDPVPLVEGVIVKPSGGADFSVAADGTLVYVAGTTGGIQRGLAWAERGGARQPIKAPPRAYSAARISPDGARVALDIRDQQSDIWIWDFARETLTRLTADPAIDTAPVWTPDGRRVVFSSGRVSPPAIFGQTADGSEPAEQLAKLEGLGVSTPSSFTPDGLRLIFTREAVSRDIRTLVLDGPRRDLPLIATEFAESNAAVSPDGRWVAYQSDESGQTEVYVRPFPNIDGGRWQISSTGGAHAAWAPNGRELFYVAADEKLMAVEFSTDRGFTAGVPRVVVDAGILYYVVTSSRSYDISPDGKRFFLITRANLGTAEKAPALTVVINWIEELKRLVPPR